MKKLLFLLAAIPLTSLVNAKVCIVNEVDVTGIHLRLNVYDFDVMGCEKGDEIRFLPKQWGNEQIPLIFASDNCDLNKPIIYNNAGVLCTYAGPKKFPSGKTLLQKKQYQKTYEAAASSGKEWEKSASEEYWRISKKKGTEPVKVGDRVQVTKTACNHNLSTGTEYLETPKTETPFVLQEAHMIYQLGTKYGDEIEVADSTYHVFLTVKKAPEPPKKTKKQKKML